ncbi:MAG: hypothetical protein ABIM74_05730 [candidate division WOR-3 bacterium]
MIKLSVSGLRGIAGVDLSPDVVIRYARAFSAWAGAGQYILARDTRPHGLAFYHMVAGALMAMGRHVVHLDVVPTPTALLHVRKRGATGGIVITASHNPAEWNALKFAKRGGVFPLAKEVEEIADIAQGLPSSVSWDSFGGEERDPDPLSPHLDAVMSSRFTQMTAGLEVAIDAVNGAGYLALPRLLEEMGARVQRLNCNGSGIFTHHPEPKKEHLPELDALVLEGKVHLGLACDPDADRLLVGIGGRGLLSEEHTLPLVAWAVLSESPGTVITNFSSSMMTEHVARRFGAKVIRVPVGESFLFDAMERENAILGGEGGGGIIIPEINPTRDALAAAGVIASLAARGELLDALSSIPSFRMVKLRFPGEDPEDVREKMARVREIAEKTWPGLYKDYSDGVYIRAEDWWIHVRPSNTEPIIRLYAEGDCEREMEEIKCLL